MSDGGSSQKAWVQKEPNAFFWESVGKKLPELTVVRLGVEPHGAFSKTVRDRFNAKLKSRAGFITVEVSEIDHRIDLVRSMILKWREQLGWKPSMHTPTGYYVFSGIEVLAYSSEVPSKKERERAFAEVTGEPNGSFEQFERVANKLAAERVAEVLMGAVEALEAKKRAVAEEKARKEREAAEKLARALAAAKRPPLTQRDRDAIKLLGVPDDYTPAELTSAKRSAQKKVHPDVSKLSPVESTRRSAAYNAAFDVLNARIR